MRYHATFIALTVSACSNAPQEEAVKGVRDFPVQASNGSTVEQPLVFKKATTILPAETGRNSVPVTTLSNDFDSCHTKGVAYYEMIGSYPTWSTGESAEVKIAEKCARSDRAFNDLD